MSKHRIGSRSNSNKVSFKSLGVDIQHNFLQAPRCDCCGGPESTYIEDRDDLISFCCDLACGAYFALVFAFPMNGDPIMALHVGADMQMLEFPKAEMTIPYMKAIKTIISKAIKTCGDAANIGIIQECKPSWWEIVEE